MEIAIYIAQENLTASERFLAAVERTMARLADFPLTGRPYPLEHPELISVRMAPVARFRRYLIFCRVVESEVQILRIVHGARDIPTLLEETMRQSDGDE